MYIFHNSIPFSSLILQLSSKCSLFFCLSSPSYQLFSNFTRLVLSRPNLWIIPQVETIYSYLADTYSASCGLETAPSFFIGWKKGSSIRRRWRDWNINFDLHWWRFGKSQRRKFLFALYFCWQSSVYVNNLLLNFIMLNLYITRNEIISSYLSITCNEVLCSKT